MTEHTNDREQNIADHMARCAHFNGIQNERCNAGENYGAVAGREEGMLKVLPCLRKWAVEPVECPSLHYPTRAEAEVEEDEINAAITGLLDRLARRECPNCQRTYEGRQVGPCVYCEHCNARLYQGTLPSITSPQASNDEGGGL